MAEDVQEPAHQHTPGDHASPAPAVPAANIPAPAPPSKSDGWRPIFMSLEAWIVLLLAVLISEYLVKHGLFFHGVPPVPLRANPLLLQIGVISIPCIAVLTRVLLANFPKHLYRIAVVTLGAVVVSCGAILSAFYPGSGSILSRDEVRPPDRAPSRRIFAIPIFFENGKPELTEGEKKRVIEEVAIFSGCADGSAFVRGFASSAAFKGEKGEVQPWRNATLANERATTVQKLLHKEAGIDAELADPWKTEPDMVAVRRIKDVGLDGKPLPKMEKLNRRVELFWDSSHCVNDAPVKK